MEDPPRRTSSGPKQLQTPKLADFKDKGWMDAADDCPDCGAPYEVRVLSIEDSGVAGLIEVRANHSISCNKVDYAIQPDAKGRALIAFHDSAGWEWWSVPVYVGVGQFPVFRRTGNHTICVNCLKMIIDIPLMVWGPSQQSPEWEARFCWNCVKDKKLSELINKGTH